ncbi:MAG: hypothetical protein ACI8ZB_003387 [Desulforhopalus sp.]
MPFVEDFVPTAAGPVPRVSTSLTRRDILGTIGARTGFYRNNYKVTPGLYCTGEPDKNSPVLVTANYKLSFDALRKELGGQNSWVLVIDTRGINVWCAGGKGTFSAEEIAYQVQRAALDTIIDHRQLILPQLCANGVALHKLKSLCGFRGKFGPIKASDLPKYLDSGIASEQMRSVTFNTRERVVLIPLEICMLWKQLLLLSILFFIVSGISKDFYNLSLALQRGTTLATGTVVAIFSGAVLTPLLLPWIPARQFWLKGCITGGVVALLYSTLTLSTHTHSELGALVLWILSCSSYLAMNFTGSTVFTSLSGVEKEMRTGLPLQIISASIAFFLWIASPFLQ